MVNRTAFRGPYMNQELNRDLISNRSNFRRHELVWCQITDLPIGPVTEISSKGHSIGTRFWPGLCEEIILVTQSKAVYVVEDDDDDVQTRKSSMSSCPGSLQSTDKGNPVTPALKSLSKKHKSGRTKQKAKLTGKELQNKQRYQWRIRLLGLAEVLLRDECQLLPWLFKPMDLPQKFGAGVDPQSSLPSYLFREDRWQRPMLKSLETTNDARNAFLLALQIAGNIEEFWSGIDRYDFDPDEVELESDHLHRRPQRAYALGSGPRPSQAPTAVCFQSIWWGAEKIWVYDMVRLNILEADLPTELRHDGKNDKEEGVRHIHPQDKAYFLKIQGIYRDHAEQKLVAIGKVYDVVAVFPLSPKSKTIVNGVVRSPTSQQVSQSTPSLSTGDNVQPPLGVPDGMGDESDQSNRYMPDAPEGYRFRQLTPVGLSHHVHIDCISGRYYPPTLKNQTGRLRDISRRLYMKIDEASQNNTLPVGLKNVDPLWSNSSLFGFTAGRWSFMRSALAFDKCSSKFCWKMIDPT